MEAPSARWLPDGRRLHLHHGPIDLIVEAFGRPDQISAAYAQAVRRFQTVLAELVDELPDLRRPSSLQGSRAFRGPTARRMEAATTPLAENFITPMAAVAGSVADEVMAAMISGRLLDRAYVNNGGDIALHLASGQELTLAIAGTGHGFADRIVVRADEQVRGVATSGWRGRSFSLGIADAVTVLARIGAEADAAATIIANAVDLPGHPAVQRQPAREIAPDSDLGGIPVTVGVGTLTAEEIAEALERGLSVAEDLRRRELIIAAALFLAGDARVAGDILPALTNETETSLAESSRVMPRGSVLAHRSFPA
ncbi:UPF0280 family protein [Pseudaminobacter sp. 19-2017]|uniref:UPF0280 family protein n=1 Tax=Pseudaminobacter soli (ex Zhang et al. 2022) TaxID=2831468 RepID=A0A942I3E6_9HYPH|nr:UPF0280 family protein [Pseudaminobacter soli]MBS3651167.1 UPF0280 family protein [Pseudaminobacter soli]